MENTPTGPTTPLPGQGQFEKTGRSSFCLGDITLDGVPDAARAQDVC